MSAHTQPDETYSMEWRGPAGHGAAQVVASLSFGAESDSDIKKQVQGDGLRKPFLSCAANADCVQFVGICVPLYIDADACHIESLDFALVSIRFEDVR